MSAYQEALLREMGFQTLWKERLPEPIAPVREEAPPMVAGRPLRPGVMPKEPMRDGQGARPARPVMRSAGGESSALVPAPDTEHMDWPELADAVASCQACALCRRRKQAVFGVGDTQADWLVVGEGPGAEEDERGEPFVGEAGKLLDAMLWAIGLRRGENVYIANTVKCRPPGNRTPESQEMAACFPYLTRQIALLKPKLIIAVGRPAAQTLLGREVRIADVRGRVFEHKGIPLIVTYHPAYLLRNLAHKALAWDDLCFIRRTMAKLA